jgi:hypothetical protein
MKKIAFALVIVSIFVFARPVASVHAQASPFVDPVPQCQGDTYEHGDLVVINRCTIEVHIAWTSSGDVWGAADLGPEGHSNTGQSSEAVGRAGGVSFFTCPGSSLPEDTQGRPVGNHYRGQYRCRR